MLLFFFDCDPDSSKLVLIRVTFLEFPALEVVISFFLKLESEVMPFWLSLGLLLESELLLVLLLLLLEFVMLMLLLLFSLLLSEFSGS